MAYTWQFGVISGYLPAFFSGILVTIELSIICIALGTIFGTIVAVLRTMENKGIISAIDFFVLITRSIPVLVILIWAYYCLPILSGVQFDSFSTAAICMVVVCVAYYSEIIRTGIESIPKGHKEAAKNLGFSWLQTHSHIILPQSFKKTLPVLLNEYITTIKYTSLASIIAVPELLYKGTNLISLTYRPLEIYTAVAAGYLALIVPLTLAVRKLEAKK